MSIVGQNSLLNQFVPTFQINRLTDKQILVFDSTRKAFVNVDAATVTSTINRLGQLLNVNDIADVPSSLQNGQALVFNTSTNLWTPSFVDFNTLLNRPTSASYSFLGLSDTANTPVNNGYVQWNSNGTQLVYSATIPSSAVTGLATVAYTGNYNDLTNKPATGTVGSVAVTSNNGITSSVANPTTSPVITLGLGNITPVSVAASGTITGSNISGSTSGTNTGDQTITLTGAVTGSGTGTFVTTLATVNSDVGTFASVTVNNKGLVTAAAPLSGDITTSGSVATLATVNSNVGTFGSSSQIPIITVNAKGLITGVSLSPASGGLTGGTAGSIPYQVAPSNTGFISPGLSTQVLVGGATPSWSSAPAISGGNITGIPNSALTNNSITIGSSSVSLGGTLTALSGLTSVTASSFTGPLTGNASTATRLSTARSISASGDAVWTVTFDGSADVSGVLTLPTINLNTGTFASVTVNSKGQVVGAAALTGDATTSSSVITFNTVNPNVGTFNNLTVNAKGLVTGASNVPYITGNQTITISGDATGSGTTSIPLTLSTINPNVGSFGSSSEIPTFTVDGKGRITSVSNLAITGFQPADSRLTALSAKTTTGLMVQSGPSSYSSAVLVPPSSGLTITNGDGVSGNPTFALTDDLLALENLSGTGFAVRIATNSWAQRTLDTGSSSRIVITNPAGVAGNPTVDLATVSNSGTGTFQKVSTDAYGRVTGTTPVTTADINALINPAVDRTITGDFTTAVLSDNNATITSMLDFGPIEIQIPTQSSVNWPVGAVLTAFFPPGSFQPYFSPATGVTIYGSPPTFGSLVQIRRVSTDTWVYIGDGAVDDDYLIDENGDSLIDEVGNFIVTDDPITIEITDQDGNPLITEGGDFIVE